MLINRKQDYRGIFKPLLYVLLLAVFFSGEAFAAPNFKYPPAFHPWYVGIGLGYGVNEMGTAQKVSASQYAQLDYHSPSSRASSGLFSVRGGHTQRLSSRFSLQMGMSLHYLNALPIEGNITGGMSADYKYMITSSALMADMALSYNPLTPHVEGLYVRLSLGASRNTAHSYKRINGDSSGSPSLGFANHTQTAFAYGVGIGAQFKVAPHLLVGPEYRYLNLGDVSLGNGHALNSGTKKVTVTDPLKWGQLKLHGMMVINVSYLF